MKLQELIDEVAKNWSFDEAKNYPGMEKLTEDEKKAFAIRHILFHQMKSIGAFAELIEQCEHGKDLDYKKLHMTIYKSLKNSLRLAKIVGISAEDIAKHLVPSRFAHETSYG